MFQKAAATGYRPVLDKIRQKTLVFGANTLLTEFRLEQGALLSLSTPTPTSRPATSSPAASCRGEPMCSP
jgi:hypothetical protein